MIKADVSRRWPHIGRFLRVNQSAGGLDDDSAGWASRVELTLSPEERAAAYEEWADYWEWRLTQRAAELAGDPVKRHLERKWTDDMAYLYRRSSALARGEDPGEWRSQALRRPELYLEGQALLAEIIAEGRLPARAG